MMVVRTLFERVPEQSEHVPTNKEHLEHCSNERGTFRNMFERTRNTWNIVRTNVEHFGTFRNMFERTRNVRTLFERTWHISEHVRTNVEHFGTCSNESGTFLVRSNIFRNVPRSFEQCSKCSLFVRTCSDCSEHVRTMFERTSCLEFIVVYPPGIESTKF